MNLILEDSHLIFVHKDSEGSYVEGEEYNGTEFLFLSDKSILSKFFL